MADVNYVAVITIQELHTEEKTLLQLLLKIG